jgi:hypothetical protein
MAAETHTTVAEVFPHIRIVMGMVIGLGVTRLLSGFARIVQHPNAHRLYVVHLGWVALMLLTLIHFWWWEFGLYGVESWTFGVYFFIFVYATLLFLLCALLFPDSMQGYLGYEDFFQSRKIWFFGLLALTYVFDVIDTLLKGEAHFARFGNEYIVRTVLFVGLCAIAAWTSDKRFHMAFVAFALIYQISWIYRLFDTIA